MTEHSNRMRRIRGWEFEGVVPWERVIASMRQGHSGRISRHDGPEPRELRCRCCGGYAGHGFREPDYCGGCREAGEHEKDT